MAWCNSTAPDQTYMTDEEEEHVFGYIKLLNEQIKWSDRWSFYWMILMFVFLTLWALRV